MILGRQKRQTQRRTTGEGARAVIKCHGRSMGLLEMKGLHVSSLKSVVAAPGMNSLEQSSCRSTSVYTSERTWQADERKALPQLVG